MSDDTRWTIAIAVIGWFAGISIILLMMHRRVHS